MSMIKRWIENEADRIASKYGYSWDDVMEALGNTNFNVEQVEHYAELEELYELLSR